MIDGFGLDIWALLIGIAFVSGIVDAIAGGGGLLTVPALALIGLDPVSVIATNKLQSTFGSASATLHFARKGYIDVLDVWPMALASAFGSLVGALLLLQIPSQFALVALPFILVLVAAYFAFSPRFDDVSHPPRLHPLVFTAGVVPLIGMYDGFFGPGTGSFFMLAFTALMGFGVVKATAHTKLANFASNAAGLLVLSLSGKVVLGLGLAMGLAQFTGAALGSRLVLLKGHRLVKPLLIVMCCAMALRLALKQWA